jgi:hypothetical protein
MWLRTKISLGLSSSGSKSVANFETSRASQKDSAFFELFVIVILDPHYFSSNIILRSALFLYFTQRSFVVCFRRFGTTYLSHIR